MRITLSSQDLNNRLTMLSKVLSNNSTPILGCFLFDVKDGWLTITASDREIVMRETIELAQCDGNGRVALQSQNIIDAVKELSDQPITFDINLGTLEVRAEYQNGVYNFRAMNAEDYPNIGQLEGEAVEFSIPAESIAESINRSMFALETSDLRPVMGGVHFDLTPEGLAIVASDGRKLVRSRNFNLKRGEEASFTMPKKPAMLVKTVLAKVTEEVTVRFNDKCCEVVYPGGYVYCLLLEGKYPRYNSVIPDDNPNLLTVDRRSMIGALRRVTPFASTASGLTRLQIEASKVVLQAEDVDFAISAKEEMTCQYTGMPMSIGFKGTTLLDVLNNLQGDEITLELADPSRPCVIMPQEHAENEDILMLIMPMLLND